MRTLFTGTMSTFGGEHDTGVAIDEGLALVQLHDLSEWWFRYLFNERPDLGLARRLNPAAFYCAARWNYNDVPRDVLRHSFMKLTSHNSTRTIFARPVDWGPNARTQRVLDLSPGAANALNLHTDDQVTGELILPTR